MPENKANIYLDHAAATPVSAEVLAAMQPYWTEQAGNPSALYGAARAARAAVEKARAVIAKGLSATPTEIIFTSGGTESDNLAIFGVAGEVVRGTGAHAGQSGAEVKNHMHVITTKVEHHAVMHAMERLEAQGLEVTYLPVDEFGMVTAEAVQNALRPDTILVSIIYANNEIGTIEPIAEIGKAVMRWRKEHKTAFPLFHTDACQAAGYLDMNVDRLHVDLLTANGSKIYGPKGIGFLYKRRGVKLEPQMIGGAQEFGMRAGTENVPAIAGLCAAFEAAQASREKESARLTELRDYFWQRIAAEIPRAALNGHPTERLPNNVNVTFAGVDAEALILYLDEHGIAAGTGSACSTESSGPSHVITAIGRKERDARGTVRFTLGASTTKEQINYVMSVLPQLVEQLRSVA